jgi:ABC-type transporter Mla MlaB component
MTDPTTPAPRDWTPAGPLTVETVAERWRHLHAQLGHGCGVRADLAGVSRVDTAGVQLLLQARRTAQGTGQCFDVQGLALPDETRRLLGVTNDAALEAAQMTPAPAVGQEG